MVAVALGVLIERLIVTDREAILMAADHAAQAIARGDVDEAMKVLHPDCVTGMGDPATTRAAIEAQIKEVPLEKVNFLLKELVIENGVGRMSIDVVLLPKDPKKVGGKVFTFHMSLEWVKVGDEWKVKKADAR